MIFSVISFKTAHDSGSVVEGRIGNEDVHEEIRRHQTVDLDAGSTDIIKPHIPLHHDERTDLLLRHPKDGP